MALRETVELDIRQAQQQINLLESQLNQASTVIEVPVEIEGQQALGLFEQQVAGLDAEIDVDANTLQARAELDQVRQSLGLSEEEAQRFAAAMGRAGDEARSVASDTDSAADAAAGAAGAAEGLAIPWGRIALQVGAALGGLLSIQRVLGSGFDRFTTIENSTRTLTIQLQDAAAAATLLDETLEVVSGTPFNLDQFANASAQLVAFGIEADKIPDFLTAIGEAAATRGDQAGEFVDRLVTVFGQVAANARISMAEVNRFADAGVNALAILGNHFELTAAEMRDFIATGTVPAGEALDALAAGIVEGSDGIAGSTVALGGTMEGLRETLTGAQGGLNAALARLGASFFDATSEQTLAFFQDMTETVDGLTPLVGLLGDHFVALADDILPVIGLLGDVAGVVGTLGDAVGGIDLGGPLSDLGQLAQAALIPTAPISVLVDEFQNLQSLFGEGIGTAELEAELADLEARVEAGADPLLILGQAFGDLRDEGVDAVGLLEELAEATGIADDDLAEFIGGLIRSADRMGLTAEEVRVLRDLLASLFDVGARGEGLNFERAGRGAQEFALNLAATTDAVEGADRALLNLVFGVDQAGNNLPVLVRDFEDLAIAADDAGVGVIDFVRNLPDDVTLNLGDAEQEVLDLIDALDEAATRLAEIDVSAAFGDVGEVDEDTGRIVGDIDQFLTDLEERAGELADLDFDLSQIQLVAPNLAELLAQSGLEAADIAAAFAANLDRAAEAEALITGAEGLAAATAEAYAEFLAELTPQQLADLAVFGADNLISPAVTGQLGDTASEIAEILADGIANSPELVLDMANATVEGLQNQGEEIASQLSRIISQNIRLDASLFATEGTTGGTTSGTGGGGGGATQNFEVNINNAVTEDVTTSATQAGQTIQAVSSLLPRVQ